MFNTCRVGLLLLLTTIFSQTLNGQNYFFSESREPAAIAGQGDRVIIPDIFKTVILDKKGMENFLGSVPGEQLAARASAPIFELPLPYGGTAKFRIWESPVMDLRLAAKFPAIKTFTGQGIDDPTATLKLDITELGFHAMVLSDINGYIFIDPYRQQDTKHYIVYYKKDLPNRHPFQEVAVIPAQQQSANANRPMAGPCVGSQLRSYRLAVACTGEYARAATGLLNPSVAQALSAIVTSINRVDGVYEKEVAVSLNLVANNENIVFVNPATDPFTANNDGSELLDESQTVITQNIGAANYDIGHTFSTGAGGIAQVESVCGPQKARGVTGASNPVGDPYDIDYVAHEMGHQFGASHSFNAVTGSCSGNRSASTAVEPGSGVTIMAYAGICGTVNNLAPFSIPYFHAVSMDEINTFTTSGGGAACAAITPTGNTAPVVVAGIDYTIPKSTSFVLSGSATDPDGDAITYSWEQIDTGPAGTWNTPTGAAPLFRSFVPQLNPIRHFPQLTDQVRNKTTVGEFLPGYGRDMNFRLTARDNKAGGGGVCFDEMKVTVNAASGPFIITAPTATGISWEAGSIQVVTWDVASTNSAPVNCANVSIQLSIDSGYTFPVTLIASTPNDGNQQIIVPNNVTTGARIRVMAVGNIFYDISNNNFTITAQEPGFNFTIPAERLVSCADPATTSASITLSTNSVLGFTSPITLSASGNPAGTTVSFSDATITPGQSTVVTLNNVNALSNGIYTVDVQGVAGGVTRLQELSFVVQPGAGPVISTHPDDLAVCAGENAGFSVAATSAVKGYQWQVSTNNGASFVNLPNETGATLTVTNTTTGQDNNQYRVLVTGQCNVTVSNPATLTVHTLPTVGLSTSFLTNLTPGQQTTLTASPSVSTGGTISLTWTLDQVPVSVSGTILPVDVTGLGDYQVMIEEAWADGNVCVGVSPVVAILAAASSKLFVYPNPSDGQFTVSYYNAGGGNTRQSVTLYDAKGAKVYYKEFSFSGPYELHAIDIRGRAKGVYFIVVGDANGKKIIDGKVLVN